MTQQGEKMKTDTLVAYHGDPKLKAATLKKMRAHQKADEIVQGQYWGKTNGVFKGCAVGCMTESPNGGHDQYPKLWGIPEHLAYLEDMLFESLSVGDSKAWPVKFLSAIPVGADLSRAWDKWQAWCLRDLVQIAGENAHVVEVMAVLFERASVGDEPTKDEWERAARAARGAWGARAARGAGDAWGAGVAWAAGAARAAGGAGGAWGARAARAAGGAWGAARHDWALRACDALVTILKESPVVQ